MRLSMATKALDASSIDYRYQVTANQRFEVNCAVVRLQNLTRMSRNTSMRFFPIIASQTIYDAKRRDGIKRSVALINLSSEMRGEWIMHRHVNEQTFIEQLRSCDAFPVAEYTAFREKQNTFVFACFCCFIELQWLLILFLSRILPMFNGIFAMHLILKLKCIDDMCYLI